MNEQVHTYIHFMNKAHRRMQLDPNMLYTDSHIHISIQGKTINSRPLHDLHSMNILPSMGNFLQWNSVVACN